MKFERGKSPEVAMGIGMKNKAPYVYRLFIVDKKARDSSLEFLMPLDKQDYHNILGALEYYPTKSFKMWVEFRDKDGIILSGTMGLPNYMGKYVQWEGEFYLIPKVEPHEL